MRFTLNPSAGQAFYLQLVQQVRHGVETGMLQDGDMLPGIRTLAQELAVGHNTVAKAYTELEHAGLVQLRQGVGAFIRAARSSSARAAGFRSAQKRVERLVADLQEEGLTEAEIQRLFESAVLFPGTLVRNR